MENSGPRVFTTTNLNDIGHRVSIEKKYDEGFALSRPHQSKEENKNRNRQRFIFTSPEYENFQASCIINNEVCYLIIDNSLPENFVAKKVVDCFQLPTKEHIAPYLISWGENECIVREVCKFPISMEKYYKAEITCDVIDMDDTDVLFGRPWYDSINGKYSSFMGVTQN